jgi:hypothetical protein
VLHNQRRSKALGVVERCGKFGSAIAGPSACGLVGIFRDHRKPVLLCERATVG